MHLENVLMAFHPYQKAMAFVESFSSLLFIDEMNNMNILTIIIIIIMIILIIIVIFIIVIIKIMLL